MSEERIIGKCEWSWLCPAFAHILGNGVEYTAEVGTHRAKNASVRERNERWLLYFAHTAVGAVDVYSLIAAKNIYLKLTGFGVIVDIFEVVEVYADTASARKLYISACKFRKARKVRSVLQAKR